LVTENSVLQQRYRLIEILASGGMGKVYYATDSRLGRAVAVKMLRDDLAHDERFVERFRREARAAASLSHPNVAGVYDYGEDEGRYFIVMEYVDGRDLARVLREEGPLSPDRAARIGAQVADALAHAHAAGLVHRDVKPANVIVLDGNRVKVTDFGIARAAGDATLTAAGSVLGTAQYISPEQAEGNSAGPQSDIYSLGIVLYEMLTGAVPFTGDSALGVAMRHVTDTVPPPSELNGDVPKAFDQVVAKATVKNPSDRYSDARAMALALSEAAQPTGEGETAPVVTPTEVLPAGAAAAATTQSVWPIPGDKWNPRRIGRAVAITLIALVAIALALVIWRLSAGSEPDQGNQTPPAASDNQGGTTPAADLAIPIPAVAGMDKDEAIDQLEGAGFVVEEQKVDSDEEKDIALGTDPAVGENLEPGQTVTLYVSSGHAPEEGGDEGDDHGKSKGHDKKD
jgi:eukaryotic-like serine/threonine-protein kinase